MLQPLSGLSTKPPLVPDGGRVTRSVEGALYHLPYRRGVLFAVSVRLVTNLHSAKASGRIVEVRDQMRFFLSFVRYLPTGRHETQMLLLLVVVVARRVRQ